MSGVKMELDNNPPVKADPDAMGSPGIYVDDDVYEDTGELTIPGDFGSQNVWLSRVPKWLWDVLANAEDDEELEIGKLMKWEEGGEQKSKLVLRQDLPRFSEVPKEYQVNTVNNNPINTFVFSEKDLEGYNPNAYKRPGQQQRFGSGPSGDRIRDGRVDKFRRGKKPIPKNTALAARSALDLSCVPVENEELFAFRARETAKTQKSTNRLVLEEDLRKFTKLIGGIASTTGSNVIKIANNKPKAKAQENKYARIPQNELLDMLLKHFKEYRYWPIKSLKEKTQQPEAYLRETLAKIATLVRTGQYANTWMLNPEAEVANYAHAEQDAIKEEMAPEPEFAEDEDDEDEGDEEMVDVV
ncbi:uncharacterized protein K452DRAFT_274586 [Aplosporella prunicola CBS 121167]|uniref:Transcription initiation factor IIF subunit beta n=1 Tax=Aplosporella prunicola CBS 121167 TaxID=1176127 RepID=A0A6A6BBW6_9PEZI|nr:uncharacterized protein K452DRAFT_274586 [Aplosporella prunicola CBS 121167]KAF2139971.1 hypothetical protein K452DRAFT_274586 [Aplosporella prunicola CBS 121167]